MIDFKDVRPSWEIGRNFKNRDDLRRLGCSDRLIDWLNPNPDRWLLMVEPEDWFWRDRDWYGNDKQAEIVELHQLSDGTFGDMPLPAQCELLNLPLSVIKGEKVKGARGKWAGRSGPVRVEDYALEHFQAQGHDGFSFEGKGYSAWLLVAQEFYRALFKRIPGFDRVNGEFVRTTPSSESAADYLKALRITREKVGVAYERRNAYYDKLWSPVTLPSLTSFTSLIGWEMIEMMHDLNFRLGASVGRGWPDLTLKKDGALRFVEVKSGDRLRGSQAEWVRDVARPLGLSVSVLQVVEG